MTSPTLTHLSGKVFDPLSRYSVLTSVAPRVPYTPPGCQPLLQTFYRDVTQGLSSWPGSYEPNRSLTGQLMLLFSGRELTRIIDDYRPRNSRASLWPARCFDPCLIIATTAMGFRLWLAEVLDAHRRELSGREMWYPCRPRGAPRRQYCEAYHGEYIQKQRDDGI